MGICITARTELNVLWRCAFKSDNSAFIFWFLGRYLISVSLNSHPLTLIFKSVYKTSLNAPVRIIWVNMQSTLDSSDTIIIYLQSCSFPLINNVYTLKQFNSQWVSSVSQSCLNLWDPMDCSTPGFPVQQQQELVQTHVHQVGDAIQPSHPLSYPAPPAFNLCQHQDLFQWVGFHTKWWKYRSSSFGISPSNGYSVPISLRIDSFDLLTV